MNYYNFNLSKSILVFPPVVDICSYVYLSDYSLEYF